MKLELPSIDELTLTVVAPNGTEVRIDPVDILDMARKAAELANAAGRVSKWKTDFTELFESEYGFEINRSQAVAIIEACRQLTDTLTKKLLPSQKQSDSTVDQ